MVGGNRLISPRLRNHEAASARGGFDPRIRWFDGFGKYLGDIAVATYQIFVKVPARHLLRSRVGRPFVERMGIRALYHGLCRDRKGNSIVVLVYLLIYNNYNSLEGELSKAKF